MARNRQLAIIDRELHRLWREYSTSKDPTAFGLLEQIDLLLEQRHDITTSHGELRHPDDVARATDWGGVG